MSYAALPIITLTWLFWSSLVSGQLNIDSLSSAYVQLDSDEEKMEHIDLLADEGKPLRDGSITEFLEEEFHRFIQIGKYEYAMRVYNHLFKIQQHEPIYIDTLDEFQSSLSPHLSQIKDYSILSEFFMVKVAIHGHQNNLFEAYDAGKEAERHMRMAGDSSSLRFGALSETLADLANGTNRYPEAVRYFERAQNIYDQHNHALGGLKILFGKANIYSRLALFEKAAELRQEVYETANENDHRDLLIQTYYYGARDSRDQNEPDKELASLKKAYHLANEGEKANITFAYLSAADISSNYSLSGRLDSATRYLRIAESMYTPQDVQGWRDVFHHKTRAFYNLAIGDWRGAVQSCQKGIDICRATNNIEAERRFGEFAAEILESKGLYAEAYPYQKRSSTLRDQIVNAQNVSRMQLMEEEYEAERKDQQISAQESTIALLDQKSRDRRFQLISSIIGLPLLFGLFYVFRSRQRAQKENLRLEKIVKERTALLIEDKKIIEDQAEELRSLDKMKNRFYANISHELRTPLTLISSPLSQIQKKSTTVPDIQRYVSLALDNTAILQERVNELLDLSKLDHAELRLRESQVDIVKLLHKYAVNFESLMRDRGILFRSEINLGTSYPCKIDEKKFEKIIFNLLDNAIKFTNRGGSIILKADQIEDMLQINVIDSGRGISPEDLPHIFDRYFQTFDPTAAARGGAGLGLALVRELTELMGGIVKVESTLGKGSRFSVELPIIPNGVDIGAPITVEAVPIDSRATDTDEHTYILPTLMIVEDNKQLREYLRDSLQDLYQIHMAADGARALEDMLSGMCHPQIILSDIMMPDMDGFALLKAVRAIPDYSKVPFCFLSAKAGSTDKIEALNIGVDDYILKPFVLEELTARLDNLWSKYQSRKTLEEQSSESKDHAGPGKIDILHIQKLAYDAIGHPQFSVDYLAQQLNISRRHLYDIIKNETGLSPSKYLREVRLTYARKLFESQPKITVKEAANQVGFQKVSYFSSLYKKRFGRLPSDQEE